MSKNGPRIDRLSDRLAQLVDTVQRLIERVDALASPPELRLCKKCNEVLWVYQDGPKWALRCAFCGSTDRQVDHSEAAKYRRG